MKDAAPLVACFVLALAGLASIVAGVFLVLGMGWAAMVAGVALLAVANFIRRGLSDG